MTEEVNYFSKLNKVDVSKFTEKKNDKFTYLSWAFAQEVLGEHHPNAIIEVREYGENNLPYLETPIGFFVQVYVTIEGVKRGRPFTVTDSANRPLGAEYWVKDKSKAEGGYYTMNRNPNSFDINTAIQRAFVKSVAEHGLGLYIYSGEDLPTGVKNDRRNFILNEFKTWRNTFEKTNTWFMTKEAVLGAMDEWDIDVLENYFKDMSPAIKQRFEKLRLEETQVVDNGSDGPGEPIPEEKPRDVSSEHEGEGGVPFPDLEKVRFIREATDKYKEINGTVDDFMTKHKKLEYADLTKKQFENLCNIVQRKLQTVEKKAAENVSA